MAAAPQDALERTYSRREWSTGLGRTAWIWSLISGTLLALLLLQVALLIALLIDRGRLDVRLLPGEVIEFEERTGLIVNVGEADLAEPVVADAPAAAASDTEAPAVVRHFEDSGLLPSVWRVRDSWWGGGLAWTFRHVASLRTNLAALCSLLAAIGITWILRLWCEARARLACRTAALEVSSRMHRQLHRQALRLGTEDLDGRGVETAIALFTDDINRLRRGVYAWGYCGTNTGCELAFLLMTALSVEVLLTAQCVLLTIVGGMLLRRGGKRAEQIRALAADRAERELRELGSTLRSARLVRGQGMDAVELEQFQTRLARYVQEVRVQNRLEDDPLWLRSLLNLGLTTLGLFMLFLIGAKVLMGEITPAGAAVFVAAYCLAVKAAARLDELGQLRTEVNVVADRLWRYLDQLPTVSQAVGARFLQPLSKRLHVESVTLNGPDNRLLLDRVDLQLTAGKSYALISLDPLEARAFACLLPRFVEPQAGRILFDGEDIAWGTLESLRAETVFVSADDGPLPGTIFDNIRAGRADVTMAQVTEVAKEARAHNFISKLPQGYDTILSPRDNLLDAGQRFRIALARALLLNPAVLIIEEPVEGLDEDTKQLIDDTYVRIRQGRTIFFLPRRVSTVRNADEVILFRHGRVEAIGSQPALLKESPLYQHWEYMNFHKFRHDNPA